MKCTSITMNTFNSRELVMLQKMYRSREVLNKLITKRGNSDAPVSVVTTHKFFVYGSMHTLSAAQRRTFRNYLSKTSDFPDMQVTITLFSSTIAQCTREFSYLQSLNSLLKGTTYQRVIIVNNTTESLAYAQLFKLFAYLKNLKFKDEISLNYTPSLIFPRIDQTQNALVPMRFHSMENTIGISSRIATKTQTIQHLLHTIESIYSKVILSAFID